MFFDKGYNDYKAFKHFTHNETGFVTRIKDNANYDILRVKEVSQEIHSDVLSDEIIEIEVKEGKITSKLKIRKVKYYDQEKKKIEFIAHHIPPNSLINRGIIAVILWFYKLL